MLGEGEMKVVNNDVKQVHSLCGTRYAHQSHQLTWYWHALDERKTKNFHITCTGTYTFPSFSHLEKLL